MNLASKYYLCIDLVPKENVQAWLKYLRSQYPTVAFKSSTQNQNERLVSVLDYTFLILSRKAFTTNCLLNKKLVANFFDNY